MDDKSMGELFASLKDGRKFMDEWKEKIAKPMSQESWLRQMQKHTKEQAVIYRRSKQAFVQVWDPLISGKTILNKEGFLQLYHWTWDMYEHAYDDPFILHGLSNTLIPYVQKYGTVEQKVFVYNCAGYSSMEISRTNNKAQGRKAVDYYRQVLSYQDEFAHFQLPRSREYILVAYNNLIRSAPSLGIVNMKEDYQFWLEFQEFCSREEVQRISKKESRLGQLMEFCENDFRGYCADSYLTEKTKRDGQLRKDFDKEFYGKLLQISMEYLTRLSRDPQFDWKPMADLYYVYQKLLATGQEITWEEAWKRMDSFYHSNQNLDEMEKDQMLDQVALMVNPPMRLIETLNHTDYPADKKALICTSYCRDVIDYAKKNTSWELSYAINGSLEEFCFNREVMQAIGSKKEELIFDSVISRHPSTYIHSLMVSKIAVLILKSVFVHDPGLLCGILHTTTPQEVLEKRNRIIRYTEKAALFHDIGKNEFIDVITIEQRQLLDEELEMIRRHPNEGAKLLSIDRTFWKYRDIVKGHHRYYNGEGGYPEEFDNRASAWKPLIDLITICDCLDAATDHLGRFYHEPKSLKQVILELEKGAGTKYHPGYIRLLRTDETLLQRLDWLVTQERKDICYDIYQRHAIS